MIRLCEGAANGPDPPTPQRPVLYSFEDDLPEVSIGSHLAVRLAAPGGCVGERQDAIEDGVARTRDSYRLHRLSTIVMS